MFEIVCDELIDAKKTRYAGLFGIQHAGCKILT